MSGKRKTYDNYDYEQSYMKSLDDMSEEELERMLSAGSVPCLYRTRTTTAGAMLRVDIYPSYYHKADQPEKKKRKESSKSQKDLNDKKSIDRLIELVNTNFGEGDYLITLEYDKDNLPGTIEDADKLCRNYIRRCNDRLKKIKQPNMKYVFVTEFYDKDGKPTRVHHHMICRCNLNRDVLEELWIHGERTQVKVARPDKDSKWLAGWSAYITKANYERRKGKRRWRQSRGLKKPVETKSYTKFSKRSVKKMITQSNFEEEFLKKYKGHELVDYQVYWNEINQSWYVRADLIRSDWQQIRKRELKKRKKEMEAAAEIERKVEHEKATKKLRKHKQPKRRTERR